MVLRTLLAGTQICRQQLQVIHSLTALQASPCSADHSTSSTVTQHRNQLELYPYLHNQVRGACGYHIGAIASFRVQ
ncbi:hypothetical protein BDZ91DRAFT_716372, partial [Kalaharituber pfeilii]